MEKLGLVLEGGGMRGLYTAGVLDVMMEKGFRPDVICGTSAGVTFGVNLPSGQKGRVLRYNTKYAGSRDYVSMWSLVTTGNVVNVKFAYDRLPRELDVFDNEAFRKSGIEFYATVTNVRTGEAEYIRLEDCDAQMDVIRASASLPFMSTKVRLGDELYLDGGLADNIPLDRCFEAGCDKVVVVLTRPDGFVMTEDLSGLARIFYPRCRNLIRTLAARCERYNERLRQIRELEKEGKIFVIRPSRKLAISRLESDPEVLKAMHGLGMSDAGNLYTELERYLLR